MKEYDFDVIRLSYCKKHKQYFVMNCPECMAEDAERNMLMKLRDKWAYEQACGCAVMSVRLDNWVKICQEAGITEDWWELNEP